MYMIYGTLYVIENGIINDTPVATHIFEIDTFKNLDRNYITLAKNERIKMYTQIMKYKLLGCGITDFTINIEHVGTRIFGEILLSDECMVITSL